jgi:hypothetical protein
VQGGEAPRLTRHAWLLCRLASLYAHAPASRPLVGTNRPTELRQA